MLDTHLGSGSSRIAAHFFGIDFYGCEIDKEYFDAANTRYEKECLGVERFGDICTKQLTIFD